MSLQTAEASAPRPTDIRRHPDEALTKVFPGDIRAVDGLDLSVHRARSSACSGRTERARRRRSACSRPASSRPSGDAPRSAASTSSRNPTLAKQVIGVVPQTEHARPGAHRLREPVLPRPLLRDERSDARATRPTDLARAVPPHRPRRRPRSTTLSGRHGPTAHGGAGDHAPTRASCSSTSRRPGSTRRAASRCGRSSASCTPTGQTILLTTHYMEEADQLCDRVAIMDHGQLLALDTPAAAQADGRRRHRW